MWKVSLVGHSQVPQDLSVPGTEIRIFRGTGGKASDFYTDSRMNGVLEWQHDLCILWLGSNDINKNSNPQEIANNIIQIVEQIEKDCQAVVRVCLVEPRFYPNEEYMTDEDYRKVQSSVNRKLQRRLANEFIHFNSSSWVEELSGDGVHWNDTGKFKVTNKLRRAIKHFMMDSDSSST